MQIERITDDAEAIIALKRRLDPFIVSEPILRAENIVSLCTDEQKWKNLLAAIDTNLAMECSVTTSAGLHSQTYFGSDAAAVLTDTISGGVESRVVDANSFFGSRQSIGGIDIIDSISYRTHCLSSLRLSLLQYRNDTNFSASEFRSEETQGSMDGVVVNRTVKNLLLWGDIRQILHYRNPKSDFFVEEDETPANTDNLHPLAQEPGSLCFKVSIGHDERLMEQLCLSRLTCSETVLGAVSNPLLLQDGKYCAWAVWSEPRSGTRSHTNVMGSHGWHILLNGRKEWRIAHPLDKFLLTNESDASLADLWNLDLQKFPGAGSARIYNVVQTPGEALFLPSEAVYSDVALDESFGIQMNFVEETCYPIFEYQTNLNSVLLSSLKINEGYLQQFTIVDVIITAPQEEKRDKLLIRGTMWCNDIGALWTELGARVELSAFHDCFESIGDYLLCLKEPHYAVGLPRGFYLCDTEHHIVLHYESPLETYDLVKEALCYLTELEDFDIRFFTAPHDAFHVNHSFSSTMSQEGSLSSYIPLSVLFNQPWPFEEKLIKTCIALPQVILEKAKHPQGFVRLGSVWHYSNKGYRSQQASPTDKECRDHASDWLTKNPIMERNSALFYCSPLFRIPITLHPRRSHFTEKVVTSENIPSIYEFEWNVEVLEKYGMVELLQFREPVEKVMQKVICSDPHFDKLQCYLVKHGLKPISQEEMNNESIIASVLWILCSPCVTGFTCPAGVQFDSGEDISSCDMYQYQMIGLPSVAASALLGRAKRSHYDLIVTQLCNWLCNIGSSGDDVATENLLHNIRSYCDVEVAEILEQIRRVKESLLNCSSGSLVDSKRLQYLKSFIQSLATHN